ncbi:MAG: PAS domain S-box protein [Deltaproteobacteria bacterium]|nr:PAS domain S-box protein [Deltaproteobacteria bacterium]
MKKEFASIRYSLATKLILAVGIVLLLSVSIWAYININYQKKRVMDDIVNQTDRLSTTIKLGTHYSMMLNSRDDINQIITNIGRQEEILGIRIYNKEGQIKFAGNIDEINRTAELDADACVICHQAALPLTELDLSQRIRITESDQGQRRLGIISPIYNEPGCATDACHVHPHDKKVLGVLDVVVSLAQTDKEILTFERGILVLAGFVFLATSGFIFLIVYRCVKQPINNLVRSTKMIARGEHVSEDETESRNELGLLSTAVSEMGHKIRKKQDELEKQRNKYQKLFELVPCIITIQDRNYKLLRYNSEFADRFNPDPGDYCYHVYKGRNTKCENCPVEKTFKKGGSHYGEEQGINKDGSTTHWVAKTSPIRDPDGKIVAVMEVCLDITRRRVLQKRLERSEKKYHSIFENIPMPVFVLDLNTLNILDCNDSMSGVYGYEKAELINKCFLELFRKTDRDHYAFKILTSSLIVQAKQRCRNGRIIIVNIRISPTEYQGQRVLLAITSEITKRLETEQQLIQSGKMATLGEMATGIAHELNQPLSVIKTASSFFMKKIRKNEPIKPDILLSLSEEIDQHVDRAAQIINHMRQFGRKSNLRFEMVTVNDILKKAIEIFNRQLKLRGIGVVWELADELPPVMGEPSRMEQVFINLLINARDAIEDRWSDTMVDNLLEISPEQRRITIGSNLKDNMVQVSIEDTGKGVPPEIRDKIFEPFFTTKEVGKGTGLGLSISYSIVRECHGDIEIMNDKRGGACFVIRFPVVGNKSQKK